LAAERRLPPAAAGARPQPWSRLVAAPLTVATLLLAALTFRTLLADRIASPWIMIDELVYSDLARSFARSGHLLIRGEHTPAYSILYPILIAPAWLARSMETTYVLAKAINALLLTLAAIPFYVWARRLVSPAYAFLALCLFLLLPSLLYAGTLMTENAFLGAFMLAALALALALERPTPARQALALGAIAVASTIRIGGLVLVAVLVTAVLVMALLERPAARERIARFWPTFAVLVLAAGGYAAVNAARGAPLSELFGAYRPAAEGGYSVGDAAIWVVRHFAELGLAVALLPVSAFVILLGRAVSGAWRGAVRERAFLAVTGASLLWFPVESGVFASRFADRIEERTMLYVQPLLLLALVLWLARGLPRPPRLTAFAFVLPAALLFALPLPRLLAHDALSDTFGLVPLLALRGQTGMGAVYAVVWGGVVLAALLLVASFRHARVLIPLAVAAALAVSAAVDLRQIRNESLFLKADERVGKEVSWIDRILGPDGNAVFLFTPQLDAQSLWQTEFWNRSVRRVIALGDDEPGGLPRVPVRLDRDTGELAGAVGGSRYVVAPRGFVVAGAPVARQGFWRLYRSSAPLRLTSVLAGVDPDGWMGSKAVYTAFRGPGRAPRYVEIHLSRHAWGGPDVPGHVRVDVRHIGASRPAAIRVGVLHSSAELRFFVRAPARPFRIRISIRPTFSPADFGFGDQRQLGARPSFRLLG
jgi:hypothetical protein